VLQYARRSGGDGRNGIAFTFIQPNFRDRIRLDSIISIVDADQIFAYPDYPAVQELKLRQIGYSDMVILNKTDLVDDTKLQEVKDWIDSRMNRVRIVEAVQCDVPMEILLGVGRFDAEQLTESTNGDDHGHKPDRDREHDHGNTFSTWSYESDRPFSQGALNEMIKKRLPANIYRCKGVIYTADYPERRVVLQVVGRRADMTLGEEWGGQSPSTQIVAIGAPGSIDPQALTAQFEACISEPAALGAGQRVG